ncbi:hypothetical protein DALLNEIH_03668 [Bacillus sp. B01(2024)]
MSIPWYMVFGFTHGSAPMRNTFINNIINVNVNDVINVILVFHESYKAPFTYQAPASDRAPRRRAASIPASRPQPSAPACPTATKPAAHYPCFSFLRFLGITALEMSHPITAAHLGFSFLRTSASDRTPGNRHVHTSFWISSSSPAVHFLRQNKEPGEQVLY